MNIPELFDMLGSSSRAFNALADFARVWERTPDKRPHFCPKQVLLHAVMPKTSAAEGTFKKSTADPVGDIKPYVIRAQ